MKDNNVLDMQATLNLQKEAYRKSGGPSTKLRIDRLNRAIDMLLQNADDIVEALREDFGSRSREQTLMADIVTPIQSFKYCRDNVKNWIKVDKRKSTFPLGLLGARSYVDYQPLGSVGVISPWNFPFALAMSPLASIFAAGNSAMIKPSEMVPNASNLMKDIVEGSFDPTELAVFTGDTDVGVTFSKLPFDHLVFTGSAMVARDVMRSAADSLTPVTLELGGKSPCFVSQSADIRKAAIKIANGKLLNCGQICLSPDYVFIHASQEQEFVGHLKEAILQMYPSIYDNKDYTSILGSRHCNRLLDLVSDAKIQGAEIVDVFSLSEGAPEKEHLKVSPTIIRNPSSTMRVMQEEIFGPLLPIVVWQDVDEVVDFITSRPRPLGFYYFGSERSSEFKHLSSRIVCGGITINDVGLHAMQEDLPFGGVGESGMGQYHGKEGFLAFSHSRAVFKQSGFDIGAVLRPPYGKGADRIIAQLMKN